MAHVNLLKHLSSGNLTTQHVSTHQWTTQKLTRAVLIHTLLKPQHSPTSIISYHSLIRINLYK